MLKFSVLRAIYSDAAWKLVKNTIVKKSWQAILFDKENEILTEDDDTTAERNHRRFKKIELF